MIARTTTAEKQKAHARGTRSVQRSCILLFNHRKTTGVFTWHFRWGFFWRLYYLLLRAKTSREENFRSSVRKLRKQSTRNKAVSSKVQISSVSPEIRLYLWVSTSKIPRNRKKGHSTSEHWHQKLTSSTTLETFFSQCFSFAFAFKLTFPFSGSDKIRSCVDPWLHVLRVDADKMARISSVVA